MVYRAFYIARHGNFTVPTNIFVDVSATLQDTNQRLLQYYNIVVSHKQGVVANRRGRVSKRRMVLFL